MQKVYEILGPPLGALRHFCLSDAINEPEYLQFVPLLSIRIVNPWWIFQM